MDVTLETPEMTTVSELREMATESRPDMESYMNCNPINVYIKDYLLTQNIECELINGSVSTRRSHIGGEGHMYVRVPSEYVSDVNSSKPVIVDGALDQFNISNMDDGKMFVSLGPKEDIPCPAIITPDDDLYDVFYVERW